jgi:hypothetical protein
MEFGHALLALAAVVVPLLLAWKLLAWLQHRRHRRSRKEGGGDPP